MSAEPDNLFSDLPGTGEEIRTLLREEAFVLEHIVSRGCASEQGFWYDQPRDEWVALICGSATLEFEGREPLELIAGDSLVIPAHVRHRVAAVSDDARWIALHFGRAVS